MKKFGMLIVMLFFAGTPFVMAQQQTPPPQQPQQMGPVRGYIQKDILPVVKQQHEKFIKELTNSEKEELAKIQSEIKDLRPGPAMRGYYRNQRVNNRAKVWDLLDQAKKIADAHPKAAAAYTKAIEARKAAWAKGIQDIREKYARGYGRNYNRTPFILDRVSDPAFGLLFDGSNFPIGPGIRQGRGPGMGYGYSNYGQRGRNYRGMGCNYAGMGRNMGYHHQRNGRGFCNYSGYGNFGRQGRFNGGWHPGMWAMNPETKKEVKAFAEKNIFPVLNKERIAFDKELKSSEKRDIENARKNITAIRAQMKTYWQDTSRMPGQRVNDSTRMAMRLDLQKNMLVVREIALKHYTELHVAVDNLREYFPKWKTEIHHIIFSEMGNRGRGYGRGRGMGMGQGYGKMMPPHQGRMMGFNHYRGMFGGVKFLLYDPANPGGYLFPMMN